jgi:exportin-2 (importin alpha re-exporter)
VYIHPTEHEIEQFEDDPLEYIRLDLSLASTSSAGASGGLSPGADGTTRRQAAADVVRALVASGSEEATTEVAGGWIQKGLAAYTGANESDKMESAWKGKDSAVYLLTAVATRGATATVGCFILNVIEVGGRR